MPAGYGRPLALDNSAWARILDGRVEGEDGARYDVAVLDDELVVCDPFRAEALHSARTARDYHLIREELDAFRRAPATAGAWARAMELQAELVADPAVSHRVKFPDLLVAACAEQAGVGILHYDKDYDLLVAHTSLTCASVWIADRGTAG